MLLTMFVGLLILKMAGVIDWSWWIIFTPLLIAFSLVFIGSFALALMGVSPDKLKRRGTWVL